MDKRWRIKDIIDLEYFLQAAESRNSDVADQTDRTIYLEHIEPKIRENRLSATNRRSIIRYWLENRRSLEKKAPGFKSLLPGDAFEEAYRLLIFVFLAAGIISGAGLAFSFLIYQGKAPLNVSSYLGVFVFLQVILIVTMLFLFFLRRRNRLLTNRFLLYSLIGSLLSKIIMKAKESSLKTLSADQRNYLQAAVGLVRSKKRIYGSLFSWPVVIIAQIFGIGFNLGVLGATILRVLSSDLAFGWQSTVQFSARVIYQAVKIMALPWSWFVPPPIAYPTLEQIEGSRMVLKEGIYHLTTQDLVSWWPFLCLAVLFYGLLPRAAFLAAAVFFENKALHGLNFDNAACDQLLFRMETPLLKTQSRPIETSPVAKAPTIEPVPQMVISAARGDVPQIPEKNVVALIPTDIIPQCDDEALNRFARQTFGHDVWQKIGIELDAEEDQKILSGIAAFNWLNDRARVLIILEAWQPPIKETLEFLQIIRKILGTAAAIGIGLIGKPESETIFTPVNEQDRNVWKQAVAQLGDPGLRIEALGDSHGR